MKSLSYKLVRKSSLKSLVDKINRLEAQIDEAKTFIREIEKGNLDIELKTASGNEADSLASSLLHMRDQMKQIAEEEKRRNWVTEGLARFVDILRNKHDDIRKLSDEIISNVVKYLNANQGALYVYHEPEKEDPYIEMIACYAYERKKFITKRIAPGEGIVGQVVLEKEPVYMTNIPPDFLKITSGLGEALPRNLLVVPLIANEKVYGIIEIASFKIFEEHHRAFIEKLGESIASTLSAVNINETTKRLLEEAQQQAEELKAQEEEMRQNMEELAATQEEMRRVMKELESREAYVNQLLNTSSEALYSVDREYRLVNWNKTFGAVIQAFGMQATKGMSTIDWYPEEERVQQVSYYERAFAGETFSITSSSVAQDGKPMHFVTYYTPLRDDNGKVFEVAAYTKDVTAFKEAQAEAEKLHREAQEQAEELRAREEELRQNLEELSSTQEEMDRILKEVQRREEYLNALINASTDSIFTIDRDYKLISFNKGFSAALEGVGIHVAPGFEVLNIFPDQKTKEEQKQYYARAFNGEQFEVTSEYNYDGNITYFTTSFCPLRDASGNVIAVAMFGRDVTEVTLAHKKTEKLAKEAAEYAEELKAQEEELRQNLEELSATQEEMQRVMKELEQKEKYANQLLDASQDLIFTIDRNYKLVSWNKTFAQSMEHFGNALEKGFYALDWYPDKKQRQEQKKLFDRVLAGESFEFELETAVNDQTLYFHLTYRPLKNESGEVYEAVIFSRNITAEKIAKGK